MIGLDKSMSLDGFITGRNPGPDQPLGEGGDRIFAWMMADRPERLSTEYTETLGDALTATGAVIMGKRSFEIIDSPEGWVAPNGTPFPWPVFVLTHEEREPVTKGKTAFTFVNDGIESALAGEGDRRREEDRADGRQCCSTVHQGWLGRRDYDSPRTRLRRWRYPALRSPGRRAH